MSNMNPKDAYRQVRLRIGNGVTLSIVQGYGTYSDDGRAEVAILEQESSDRYHVHEPQGWQSANDLIKIIRKAQRLAKKRGVQNGN